MKRLLVVFVSFLLCLAASAQGTREVTGTVKDENGEALAGASVIVKGGSNKNYALTDIDGKYKLSARLDASSVLVFSYLGMLDAEVVVGNKKQLDVVLKADRNALEEAVITAGYGLAQKRSDMTGSAYQVTSNELSTLPAARIDNMLNGLVPGMVVDESGDGAARSRFKIRIRGDASLSANCEPLWVVDGVPVYTGSNTSNTITGMSTNVSPLSFLNPDDIESITVLKDAATTSLYGADGANGVILVTTRQGKGDDKVRISADVLYGISYVAPETMTKYCNAEQWMSLAQEAWTNAGYLMENFPYRDNEHNSYSTTDTDWQKVYFGMGSTQEVNLKADSGTSKAKHYLSASFNRDEGTVKGNVQNRFSIRERSVYKLGKRVSADINLNASYNVNDLFSISKSYLEVIPIFSPYDEDGVTPRLYNYYSQDVNNYNPVMKKFFDNEVPNRDLNDNRQMALSANGTANLKIEIAEGLTATIMGGVNTLNSNELIYYSKNTLDGLTSIDQDGVSRRSNAYSMVWNNIDRLNFNRNFGKHSVGAMAGIELVSKEHRSLYATGYGFANDNIKEIGYSQEASRKGYSSASNGRSLSYLASLNWSYDKRYYLSASYRRQGTSSFSEYAKWGDFSSIGLSWNVHNERFWNVKWMDKLKFKASFGNSGNSRVDTGSAYGTYSYGSSYAYGGAIGAIQSAAPNPGLSWENTWITNLGLDISLFDGRIELNTEVYDKYTTDLLYKGFVSSIISDDKVMRNVGELENRGFELEVISKNIVRDGFKWTTSFNGAVNRNIIRKLYNGMHTGFFDYVWMEGASKDAWWLSRWAGVDPVSGAPMWYDANGDLTYSFSYNNRVLLSQYDKQPDFRGGMRNTISWGDWSLVVFLTYTIGGWDYVNMYSDGYDIINENVIIEELDHWRKPGDISANPRHAYKVSTSSAMGSTRFLYSKTSVQLNNLALSYNLPKSVCRFIGASSATATLIGNNLFFWTPDQSRDRNSYKTFCFTTGMTRNFSVQLSVNF